MKNDVALLIMDMQQGNFEGPYAIVDGQRLIHVARDLIQKAREADVPIVYVMNNGPPGEIDEPGSSGWEIHSGIRPRPDDIIIQKSTPDAFHETGLKDALDEMNIQRLVIMGLQTEFCVDTTCRRGALLGYTIQLVKDGHSTWDSDALSAKQIIDHHNAVLSGWFVELVSATNLDFRAM
jgi:nicotinamidase-related amidase